MPIFYEDYEHGTTTTGGGDDGYSDIGPNFELVGDVTAHYWNDAFSGLRDIKLTNDVVVSSASSDSFLMSRSIDVSQFSHVEMSFFHRGEGLEGMDNMFLEYQYNNMGPWLIAKDMHAGVNGDLENGLWNGQCLQWLLYGGRNTTIETLRIRFRPNGNDDMDMIYIDDVEINGLLKVDVPTEAPTASPSQSPTLSPTASPTKSPTPSPTASTPSPTQNPTNSPTAKPTAMPTEVPTPEVNTAPPVVTNPPTASPTKIPTSLPTENPTNLPTKGPTRMPTGEPTEEPTQQPTTLPTKEPTQKPTEEPTQKPTPLLTDKPTKEPTQKPTAVPTQKPTPVVVNTAPPVETNSPSPSPTKAPTIFTLVITSLTTPFNGNNNNSNQKVKIEWRGGDEAKWVDIYRDGSWVQTRRNNGTWNDHGAATKGGYHTYQVCESETTKCSPSMSISL